MWTSTTWVLYICHSLPRLTLDGAWWLPTWLLWLEYERTALRCSWCSSLATVASPDSASGSSSVPVGRRSRSGVSLIPGQGRMTPIQKVAFDSRSVHFETYISLELTLHEKKQLNNILRGLKRQSGYRTMIHGHNQTFRLLSKLFKKDSVGERLCRFCSTITIIVVIEHKVVYLWS